MQTAALFSPAATDGRPLIAVCSARARAPTAQSGKRGGGQWWARDPYHVRGEDSRTLCGRDCSEWLVIGPMEELSADCCLRCRARAEATRHD
jgi:hypothetical protein